MRAAFAAGELSYSKVRAVCRVARPETEAVLLELARAATTSQLEEIVRTYRSVTGREELDQHNERHLERFARWYWDDDGSLVITARLSPEDGAVVLAAMEMGREVAAPPEKQPADPASDSAESLPAEARSADALVAAAKLALVARGDAEPPPPAVLIVDRATLEGADEGGRSYLEGVGAIPPECARRLACDAKVTALLEGADGSPLDLGRSQRTPSIRLRRALRRRDGGCRFPGCGQRRFLHAHHIVHWSHGGETKLWNLILLCGRHHRLLHEGGFRIESRAGGEFAFFDRNGQRVPEVPPAVPVGGPPLAVQNELAGLAIDPETCRSLGNGGAYDLGMTIDALVSAENAVASAGADDQAA